MFVALDAVAEWLECCVPLRDLERALHLRSTRRVVNETGEALVAIASDSAADLRQIRETVADCVARLDRVRT